MSALVVPGVRVEARFDVLPPLPAPSGILGAAGIVDRLPPAGALIGVTKASELRDIFGPGTEATMPEVFHALASGASEVVISPVLGGHPAQVQLLNVKSAPALFLRCRSNGAWGNDLAADVRATVVDNKVVRSSIRIYRDQILAESFDDLQADSAALPNYLFDTINARSKLVVAIDPRFETAVTLKDDQKDLDVADAGLTIKTSTDKDAFVILPAVDPTGMKVTVRNASTSDDIDIDVVQNTFKEEFRDLSLDPDSPKYLPDILLTQSLLIRVRPARSLTGEDACPNTTGATPFTGGTSPKPENYQEAIDLLANDTRIDLVLASIEPKTSNNDVRTIHQALLAHAIVMTDAGAPRIAFGSVTADEQKDEGKIKNHAAQVRNRRFVLVSPAGAAGAVAGMVGRMNAQDSPTFKGVTLFGLPAATYSESMLNKLLGPNINLLVVQDRAGRGVIVLKGIDTTGDQISVTRVADAAIRATKATAENFIGQLNTEDARVALKQQLIATFIRMERDGALVPSTDGKDPAFVVDVYSTQQDFAQGIVRIDIAVRPVRSIDYVYATIRVKN